MKNKNRFYKCSRCGLRAFEYLQTYGHCVNCLEVKELGLAIHSFKQCEQEFGIQYSDHASCQNYLKTIGEV